MIAAHSVTQVLDNAKGSFLFDRRLTALWRILI